MYLGLTDGFLKMWSNKRMVGVFYLVNLLTGLLIIWPFMKVWREMTEYSLVADLPGGVMNFDVVMEMMQHYGSGFKAAMAAAMVLMVVSFLLSLFLSAGAIGLFASRDQDAYTAAGFFGHAGDYFGRFLRLFLWSGGLLVLVFFLGMAPIMISAVIYGDDAYRGVKFWGAIIAGGWTLTLLFFYVRIMDYARIYTVASEEHNMRRALLQGMGFVLANPVSVTLTGLTVFIFGACAVGLFAMIPLEATGMGALIGVTLIRQIQLLLRATFRVTLYAAESSLYLDRTPQITYTHEPSPSREEEETWQNAEARGASSAGAGTPGAEPEPRRHTVNEVPNVPTQDPSYE